MKHISHAKIMEVKRLARCEQIDQFQPSPRKGQRFKLDRNGRSVKF